MTDWYAKIMQKIVELESQRIQSGQDVVPSLRTQLRVWLDEKQAEEDAAAVLAEEKKAEFIVRGRPITADWRAGKITLEEAIQKVEALKAEMNLNL